MPLGARIFVTAVAVAGLAVLTDALRVVVETPPTLGWYFLVGLIVASSSFPLRSPGVAASLSLSEAFVFTCVLCFGSSLGVIAVAIDGLTLSLRQRSVSQLRVAFNVTQPPVAICAGAAVFAWLVPAYAVSDSLPEIATTTAALAAMALVTFGVASLLNATVVALSSGTSWWAAWNRMKWVAMNYFAGASLASLLTQRTGELNAVALGLLAPLLVVFYLIFSNFLARTREAQEHLDRLNRLYLSTIETLAMAIDAKDQVTHGHIRRVQLLAVGLAKQLGIQDARQIQAIEAAALLHDMGKLAIPEHILNKPGKLSPAEFEQMKQHAAIGADILSRIEFPYPVVPIVRHHHEWWNGGGYPDNLTGAHIPVGARILSVVDCYDALVSDRPYRRALSNAEALNVLAERRGTMYDPLIVDTFARVHQDIVPALEDIAADQTLQEFAFETPAPSSPVAQPRPMVALLASPATQQFFEALHRLSAAASTADVTARVAQHLARQIPSDLTAFYLLDHTTQTLRLTHAFGLYAADVRGLTMPIGERLSGWVAANQRTIANSDGSLDLTGLPRALPREMLSCLATPLASEGRLIGVLTLYSHEPGAFAVEHQQLLDDAGPTLAHLLAGVVALDTVQALTLAGARTRLPQLYAEIDQQASTSLAVVALSLEEFQNPGGMQLRGSLASTLQRHLRPDDRVIWDEEGLIAILDQVIPETAAAVATRVQRAVNLTIQQLHPHHPTLSVQAGFATSSEASNLAELVKLARQRAHSSTGHGGQPARFDRAS